MMCSHQRTFYGGHEKGLQEGALEGKKTAIHEDYIYITHSTLHEDYLILADKNSRPLKFVTISLGNTQR